MLSNRPRQPSVGSMALRGHLFGTRPHRSLVSASLGNRLHRIRLFVRLDSTTWTTFLQPSSLALLFFNLHLLTFLGSSRTSSTFFFTLRLYSQRCGPRTSRGCNYTGLSSSTSVSLTSWRISRPEMRPVTEHTPSQSYTGRLGVMLPLQAEADPSIFAVGHTAEFLPS